MRMNNAIFACFLYADALYVKESGPVFSPKSAIP